MTTFKMPDAVAARWPTVPGSHKYCGCKGCSDLGVDMELLYTVEALRDVLEQAAHVETIKGLLRAGGLVTNQDAWTLADRIEAHIRAMKEQIK
jgi:hypothetical protein